MFNVVRTDNAAGFDGLYGLTYQYAVHDDLIVGVEFFFNKLVFGRYIIGKHQGFVVDRYGFSGIQVGEGNPYVVVGVNFKKSV